MGLVIYRVLLIGGCDYFIMRGREGMDNSGIGGLEELGGVAGGGNIIRIHYVRTVYFQLKKGCI